MTRIGVWCYHNIPTSGRIVGGWLLATVVGCSAIGLAAATHDTETRAASRPTTTTTVEVDGVTFTLRGK